MPSPFTSSFASAAAGTNNSDSGFNGRNTGSGDWYVPLPRGGELAALLSYYFETMANVLVDSILTGRELVRMAQLIRPFEDPLLQQAHRIRGMAPKRAIIPHLQQVASMYLHT